MKRAALGMLGLAILVMTGCTTSPISSLAPPTAAAPDLRGTWTGTWGGSPLRLVIFEQRDASATSGIYVGSWQVAGRRLPGVSGIITFTNRGDRVSVGAQGWVGVSNDALRLVVAAAPSDGNQQLVLRLVDGPRLVGNGTSAFRWGPQGTVELTRTARPQ